MQSHIEALERKHAEQEEILQNCYKRPQTPEWLVQTVKRRKLKIKDEIERLRATI
ncbi:MAG: DUF465 domain-containing protein [Bacteroidetes bacterium]|nr:DUF465 domain-containing protein [bacterium]NBP64495.1 DUF465 domain-containing protein [Bacteroidota bacterium]